MVRRVNVSDVFSISMKEMCCDKKIASSQRSSDDWNEYKEKIKSILLVYDILTIGI